MTHLEMWERDVADKEGVELWLLTLRVLLAT